MSAEAMESNRTAPLTATVLVDDHVIFCDGLEKLLNDSNYFAVIGKFHTSSIFLNAQENMSRLQLLIMDIEMPELNGLELIRKIRQKDTQTKIVILSMHDESTYVREAYQSGANGYLVKSVDSNTLIKNLTQIMQGENIFPVLPSKSKTSSPLSEQETRIVKLIATGINSKEIALHLNLSPLTVQAHRRNILKKLKVNNTAELIRLSFSKGFIE